MPELPVLNNTTAAPDAPAGRGLRVGDVARRGSIARDLARLVRGQVRFGDHDRMLYATDASLYQVAPIGVVVPADVADVERVVRYCGEHGVALLPRGGGTSLAGQCTNEAVVVDMSAGCRGIGPVETGQQGNKSTKQQVGEEAKGAVWVEPGVTVDELNRELARRDINLFFAPDPATTAQATIGGCIGNNAAGGRSIRYGRTSENILGVDAVLTTGERVRLEPGAGLRDAGARRLGDGVVDVVRRHAELIRQRYPKTQRQNAGYALDRILSQVERGATGKTVDLSTLLCGSEGTLAVVLGAMLRLHPLPTAKGLAVISFASLEDAIEAVRPILDAGLARGLTAVELLDGVVLDAARGNLECRRYVELLPGADAGKGEPKAVLYVEFFGFARGASEVEGAFAALRGMAAGLGGVRALACHVDAPTMLSAWKLRKAGEPLLHGLPGRRKPVTFVEDNAVPVERLGEFVREFKRIVARHGTRAAYWAHASVGVLHVRPMIDLHDPADRDHMRQIAVEVADLARSLGGVMSGEHGDGRVRGPLLERFFGSELVAAFAQVKRLFDPAGVLNPGDIVGAGGVETITQNLRALAGEEENGRAARQQRTTEDAGAVNRDGDAGVATYFAYDDQHGLRGAAEMCNGAGVCRKRSGGTMCPSYMATMDERHSTRGRGNALRLAITGQIGRDGAAGGGRGPSWDDDETMRTLDLCLSCKACKSECPSNVDIARLKAEYTAQRYKQRDGAPLAARIFGHVRALNRLGAAMPGVANWAGGLRLTRAVMRRLLGISENRSLPRFERSLYRWFAGRADVGEAAGSSRRTGVVALFADCFTTYNEPRIGRAAMGALERLGYEVRLYPRDGGGGLGAGCCGRAMISTGLLEDAITTADRTLELLRPAIEDAGVETILVCEPSCLSAFKDDWLQLKLRTPMALRRALADKAMLVEEFVGEGIEGSRDRGIEVGREKAGSEVILHGHCHQKALWGIETSAAALRSLVGDRLRVLDSGCCGLAGSFGYAAHRYELSMKIGELTLMPAVRAAGPDAVIVAPGTSCRHQIHDATGRRALHPIELIADLLRVGERPDDPTG